MKRLGLLILLWTICFPVQAGVQGQLRQGGKLYEAQKYGSALNVYNEILKNHPEDQRALFNAGNAYYRLNEYTQAEETYKQAAQQAGSYSQDALYNLGNAYYKAGDKQKAIEAFKQAIFKNPQDKEAVHNLQLLLQEQQNKNNQQNDQNQQNQNQDSDNQSQQDQQQNQGQNPQENKQDPNQQQQPKMSKQDADRVMSMAKENEYKPNAAGNQSPNQQVEKDW